jgi:hypothetical protein
MSRTCEAASRTEFITEVNPAGCIHLKAQKDFRAVP